MIRGGCMIYTWRDIATIAIAVFIFTFTLFFLQHHLNSLKIDWSQIEEVLMFGR